MAELVKILNLFQVGLSSLQGCSLALEGRMKVAHGLIGIHNAGCHHAQLSLSPAWHWTPESERNHWKP